MFHCGHISHSIVYLGSASCHEPTVGQWIAFLLLCSISISTLVFIGPSFACSTGSGNMNSLTWKNEEIRIAAYQRGWNEAQDWQQPHLNPYPAMSDEWMAWWDGYNEGRTPTEH